MQVESRVFDTAYGAIPIRGSFTGSPTVLAITGMLSDPTDMQRLPEAVGPHHAGLVGRLPGHGAPQLSETSIAAFAAAFDQVADRLGPTVVLGLSIGALVALSMRSSNVRRVVAVEPPLETGKLWQLGEVMLRSFDEHQAFYENVMGFDGKVFVGRDYLDLLDDLPVPTDFVVGDEPLFPARPAHGRVFSMVDEAQRRLIRRSRNATLHVAPNAGHAVQRQAGAFLLPVVFAACRGVGSMPDGRPSAS